MKWLLEGDRNTRFFHSVTSARRRNNFIENISFDGVIKILPSDVRNGVANFYER